MTTLTKGETALLEMAEDSFALRDMEALGLPTSKVEAWHYTDLRARIGEFEGIPKRPTKKMLEEVEESHVRLTDSDRIAFVNGYFAEGMSKTEIDGVNFGERKKREDALALHASRTKPEVASNTPRDAVGWINDAFVSDGYEVTIKKNKKIKKPIGFLNVFVGNQDQVCATNQKVTFEEGSSATVIDRYCGDENVSYLSSSLVDVKLKKGSKAVWVLDQEEGDATRLARLNVTLEEDAHIVICIINAGGKLVRQELNLNAKGKGAKIEIFGVNLIGGDSHIDVTSVIQHTAPETTANEVLHNIVTDKGKGVFAGQIKVAQVAQLTDAKMSCNTLLLSDNAEFNAKPELEIFADDVQCGHGATIADLNHDYLFYLMARGIDEKNARRLLVRAFVAGIIEELEEQTLVDALETRLDEWMDNHV